MACRPAVIALALVGAFGCTAQPARSTGDLPAAASPRARAFEWTLPPGLPVPRVPDDNPMTGAKVQLGRQLFYDRRLSGTGTFACATCHQQRRAFTDGLAHAIGSTGEEHHRSTMSLTNVAYNASYGWSDPSLQTLESQTAVPMFNEHPIEMGLRRHERAVIVRFAGNAQDVARFRAAFPEDPDPVTLPNIVKAIAAFERTLVSGDSPFDRYLYLDDRAAMPASARRGMDLFFSERLRCAECHASFNLSGPVTFEGRGTIAPVFHHTGLYDVDGRGGYPAVDRGLFDKTQRPTDVGRFRAPTLRNIAVTAPYMHDGSVPTLGAAVAHYARGGRPSPLRSERVRGFTLSDDEAADLVAFLESLTDDSFLTNPAFADPAAPQPGGERARASN
ncbi:MAG: MbnH family di-heme enzyme [Vicinamibacterales bacterium]